MATKPPRYAIRVDPGMTTEKTLEHTLPIERAERVARRAVSQYGLHDIAEVLDETGDVAITYARYTDPADIQPGEAVTLVNRVYRTYNHGIYAGSGPARENVYGVYTIIDGKRRIRDEGRLVRGYV